MPYSHIRIAFGQPSKTSGLSVWTGQRCDVYIGGGPTWDHSILYQTNPDILIFPYYSGTAFYRRTDPGWTQWSVLKAWLTAHPEYEAEDLFWHYRDDVQYQAGDGSARENFQIVAGYPLGMVPGVGGSATARAHSRVPHGHWGAHITTQSWMRPYQATIVSMQREDNVVTVITAAAHGFEVDEHIAISNAGDGSFNGAFDVTEVLSPTSFQFAQTDNDLSTTGGTATFWFLSAYSWNYKTAAARACFNAEGVRTNVDAAGNKTNGNFFDSWCQQNVYSADGTVPDGTPLPYGLSAPPNFFDEFYDDNPGGGDVAAGRAWLRAQAQAHFESYRAAIQTLRGDNRGFLCGNGDGVNYMMINATLTPSLQYTYPPTTCEMWNFYRGLQPGDVILIEGGLENSIVLNGGYWEIKWKNLWTLMDEGKRLIWQVKSTTLIAGVTWTNYSPNVWYTDDFNDSLGCPITYYSGGGLVLQNKRATLAEVTSAYRFYWDPALRRLYGYSTTDPTTTASVQVWGYEPSRFFNLAMYYTFGRHGEEGIYQHHDWSMGYGHDTWDPISWFEAMAYDVGQPISGGRDINDAYTTNIWGLSTEVSNRGYVFWSESAISLLYGRRLQKGMAVFRPCPQIATQRGTGSRSWTTPFTFRRLRGDGTLDAETTTLTLAYGEGAILITNWGDTPPPDPEDPDPDPDPEPTPAVKRIFGITR